jgi:glycosyltransferase involved in cell wall biosynthesis
MYMKVALVYDRVNKWGGAERVLMALHELFPDAPLYTALYDSVKAPWAKVFPKVITSFLQKITWFRDKHEFLGALMPLAFETFNFNDYDLVISVTSEAAKGIITKPGTRHICYCLTPTRYLWSGYNLYFSSPILKWLTQPIIHALRKWDKVAASRPDEIIAISSEVQKRIKKYYGRDSQIIFPPVNRGEIIHQRRISPGLKNYFLVVSRLVKYKRVDLAIKVFNKLGHKLVIVGTGSEESKLKKMAKSNIKFVGQVNEEKLTAYYHGALALVFPQEEDFGITAVEAQASGVPVIAFNKGGVLDTVTENKTGLFFDEQSAESLEMAVKKFAKIRFKEQDLKANALRFSKVVFSKRFSGIIRK